MNDQFTPPQSENNIETPAPETERKSKFLAVISMIVGIASIATSFSPYSIMTGIAAIILSFFDRKNTGACTQNKLALIFGIIGAATGILFLVIIALSGDVISELMGKMGEIFSKAMESLE
jgi:uncharacterized membrane protein HdeD (DUF308 family)